MAWRPARPSYSCYTLVFEAAFEAFFSLFTSKACAPPKPAIAGGIAARYDAGNGRNAGVTTLTSAIAIEAPPGAGTKSAPGLPLLASLLAALLLIRILAIAISAVDLHPDEAQYWYWAQDFAVGRYNGPPLVVWLAGLAGGVCGNGELCLRLPSPLLAIATSFVVYALGRRLYDRRIAFWAALAYATLPAVSVFSFVLTPDLPLAFFAAVGALLLWLHFEKPSALTGLLLGVALGLGFDTGPGMIYLPIGAALYALRTPSARPVLKNWTSWLAVAVALVVALPGLLAPSAAPVAWGIGSSFSANSLAHIFDPDSTLLFLGLQFVLLGPVFLFVYLRSVLAQRVLSPRPRADRFLLCLSLPVLVISLIQAFVLDGKAHWTLPAAPALTLFVTALLLRYGFKRLLAFCIVLHAAILAVLVAVSTLADRTNIVGLDRLVGWRNFSLGLAQTVSASDVKTVVLDRADQAFEVLYYLRGSALDIRTFLPRGRAPRNDFQQQRGWAYGDSEPVLLATGRNPSAFGIPLGAAAKIGDFPVASGLDPDGVLSLYRVNPPTDSLTP